MEMESCAPNGKSEEKNEALNTAASIGPRINKPEAPSGSASGKTAAPLKDTDVGEIVTKSKKAAASLWTLLHAKVRVVVGLQDSPEGICGDP
jgi:hypothetical protein